MNDRRMLAVHVAIIMATPWLILAVHPNLFINPNTNIWIDSWVNTGFFLSLPEHLTRWGGTYYSTRLSWLLPGFVVHQLLSPLSANYVLHVGFFYALLFSLYALVAAGVNRTAALLVTLLVAWDPELLASMSWDYVDGAVITYFVVTLLCLEKAAAINARWWAWAAGAGAGLACLVTANLVGGTLWPVCGLFLLLRVGVARWRRMLAVLAVSAATALMVFVVFGFANQQLGGRFIFLAASFTYARERMWLPSPWEAQGAWLGGAMFLVLPAVAALGAVLAFLRRSPTLAFAGAVQLTLLAAVVWWMIHSALWTHSIHIWYYTSYLIPLALLALAVHPDSPVNGVASLRPRQAIVLILAILGALIAQLLIVRNGYPVWQTVLPERLGRFLNPYGFDAFVAFAIAGLALVSLRFIRTAWYRWPAFLLALVMVYSSVPMNWAASNERHLQQDFAMTVSAHRFIGEHLDERRRLRVWYKLVPGEPRPFKNISSTYLWGWSLINEAMPSLEPAHIGTLEPGSQLLMMTTSPGEVDTARQALRKVGFEYVPRVRQAFGRRDAHFWVSIGDLSLAAAATP